MHLAGRRQSAARGPERAAGAHALQPPRLLPALGQDLGVPGPAQGPPGRGRPGARRGVRGGRRAPGVAGRRARQFRPRRAEDAPPGRRHHPRGRGGARAEARPRRAAGRRIRRTAAAVGARPQSDTSLRSGSTLEALEALAAGGYVGRADAAQLDEAYRFLRAMEHRIQLYRLRRTHLVPEDEADLRRLGRSLGLRTDPVAELNRAWSRHASVVRRLHEKLFYRPLLDAVAQLAPGETRLVHGRGPRTPGRPRLRRPRRGPAPPGGPRLRGDPQGRDPAHAASGAARLVRGLRRPGRGPARLPQGVRRARQDPLVPAAAA